MEKIEVENQNNEKEMMQEWERGHRRGKVFGGMIVVAIGSLFLAREIGVDLPHWLFSWKMLLIVLGIYTGVKHSFRHMGWLVMVFIGSAFLLQDIIPEFTISHYIWPIAIILFGLAIIFKPRRTCRNNRWKRHYGRHNWQQHKQQWQQTQSANMVDDYLNVDAVFGSVKKNIISKNFKGGEINTVLGSAEINLSQADIMDRVVLEINTVLGGTKLIVPPHWEIKSELTAVLGSVEDKRPIYKDPSVDGKKILVLKGNAVLGGIEITSF